jgi:hypothetical protein
LLPTFSQVRRQQITGIVIEQASAPRSSFLCLIATGTPDGNQEPAAIRVGISTDTAAYESRMIRGDKAEPLNEDREPDSRPQPEAPLCA